MSLFHLCFHGNVATRAVQLLFKEELQHEKEAECDEPEGYTKLFFFWGGKSAVRDGDGHRSKWELKQSYHGELPLRILSLWQPGQEVQSRAVHSLPCSRIDFFFFYFIELLSPFASERFCFRVWKGFFPPPPPPIPPAISSFLNGHECLLACSTCWRCTFNPSSRGRRSGRNSQLLYHLEEEL